MILLREYQRDIIDRARARMRAGVRSLIIVAPTGSGKTILSAFMTHGAEQKGKRTLFVVHRRELMQQSARAFDAFGINYGLIASGEKPNHSANVQIATVQTLERRLMSAGEFGLVIWDECHHNAAGTWVRVYDHFRGAHHIGLSATPQRLDGAGLSDYFSEIVRGPSVTELINAGYLSRFKVYCPGEPPQKLRKRFGEYAAKDVASAMSNRVIVGSTIENYNRLARGKRAVAFCATVEHGECVANAFNDAGISAKNVSGETPRSERDSAMADFASGKILVLCNCDLFNEGLDIPGIECAMLMRPTLSFGLHRQQIGRALRVAPGKDCAIILDFAGNTQRHGWPDDEVEWSIDGNATPPQKDVNTVKLCKLCFAANRVSASKCFACGNEFAAQENNKRSVEEIKGDLVEAKKIAATERKRAKSLDDLIQLGKLRNYKNPHWWARCVYESRMRRT